jgi:uncharacterized protein (DUF1501 family)
MSRLQITTRRAFLQQGLGVVGVGGVLPNFLIRTALAGPAAATGHKILVVLQLSGGHDGMSAVVPYAHEPYAKLRRATRIPTEQVIKLDAEVGLHPNLKGFKELLDKGLFAVVQGVGYPNPNLSHFEAMDIWHTADARGKGRAYGWLGRYCDHAFKGNLDPVLSISVGSGIAPLAIWGQEHPGLNFYQPDSFRYQGDRGDQRRVAAYKALNDTAGAPVDDSLAFVTQTAVNANASSEQIRTLASKYQTKVTYPNSALGQSLKTVAGLIAGGLNTRIYYVYQGGYDTHGSQKPHHDNLMSDLSGSVAAFYQDLTAQQNLERVLTMSFSEFGRRADENGSQGTDHGTAGPMFLFGKVKPGVHGKHPSLTDIPDMNLKFQVDFRSVYAALLDKWLGASSHAVLGPGFAPLDCIAG